MRRNYSHLNNEFLIRDVILFTLNEDALIKLLYRTHPKSACKNQKIKINPEVRIPNFLL